jgi:hypothetical protein
MEAVLKTLPIWLTLVLLLITHVPALKLQDLLRRCVLVHWTTTRSGGGAVCGLWGWICIYFLMWPGRALRRPLKVWVVEGVAWLKVAQCMADAGAVRNMHVLPVRQRKRSSVLHCSTTPSFTIHLGTLGQFSLSPALVLQLKEIFTHVSANWTAELLHIPCLVPFVVVSCVTLAIFRRELKEAAVGWHQPFATAWGKISGE